MCEKKGVLVAIEGIDGTGKTTLAEKLKSWLESRGFKAAIVKEPGNSIWGRKIRESYSENMDAMEELELFLKDRAVDVKENILPKLCEGYVVLMDRYYYSNMAYQGARGIDMHEIRSINENVAPEPDMVILLDCDPELCLRRIESRGKRNRFESLEYLKKVRKNFLDIAREDEKVKVVDASRSEGEVFEEAKKLLNQLLRKSKG